MNRSRIQLLVQVMISVGTIVWVLMQVNWHELLAALLGVSVPLCAVLLAMYYLGVALSCWKWQVTLHLEQIRLPFSSLLRWYLIGAFASNFLPTDMGGDLGRGLLAGRATGKPLAVARSILVERLSGLLVLTLLAWLGFVVLLDARTLAAAIAWGAMLAFALGVAVLSRGRNLEPGSWLRSLWKYLPARLRDAVGTSAQAIAGYIRRPLSLALIATISCLFQLLAGVGLYLNLRAVGAELPLTIAVLAGAMATIAGLLPIAVNGWGVREGLLVTLLLPFGVAASHALAASLLARALTLFATLPGALLLVLERQWAPSPVAASHDEG